MIRALSLILALVFPAMTVAAPIVVTSGEHDGFTRLVFSSEAPLNWSLGATQDGYTLRVQGDAPTFDLANAFRIIGASRLAVLESQRETPDGAELRIVLNCACHARPFNFRPGVLVVDLRDGPPPPESPHEQPLTPPAPVAGQADTPAMRPRPRPWAPPPLPMNQAPILSETASAPPSIDPALAERADTRAALLRELSAAAVRGVVQMEMPPTLLGIETTAPMPGADHLVNHLRSGTDLGMVILQDSAERAAMTESGQACIADARLALREWGLNEDIGPQMADARRTLLAEFDHTNQDALTRYVRLLLYATFGAEARQAIDSFDSSHQDRTIWRAMGALLDGDRDGQVFAGMEACDTDAAFWALLDDPGPVPSPNTRRDAVLRAFSGLPAHLRRHFAPALSEKFAAAGDASALESIRVALERLTTADDREIQLVAAHSALAGGDPEAAEARLADLREDHSRRTETGVAALALSLAAQDKPVPEAMVVELQALAHEYRDTPGVAEIHKALAIAAAAAGQYDLAFASLSDAPHSAAEVWRLMARNADDDLFLARAVLEAPTEKVELALSQRQSIAERLLALGFPDHALAWLAPELSMPLAEDAVAIVAAQAHLGRNDPAAALRLLVGVEGAFAQKLAESARAALPSAPLPSATVSQLAADRAWRALAAGDDPLWAPAARWSLDRQGPVPPEGAPAMARSQVADSQATRAALERLLSGLTPPAPAGAEGDG